MNNHNNYSNNLYQYNGAETLGWFIDQFIKRKLVLKINAIICNYFNILRRKYKTLAGYISKNAKEWPQFCFIFSKMCIWFFWEFIRISNQL